MQTINADSSHPLDRIDYLLPLALKVDRSNNNPLVAKLNFDIAPDSIKVNSWFFGKNAKTKSFDADVDCVFIKKYVKYQSCQR